MTHFNACGLMSSPDNCFIDHLAPLCYFLNIPIITQHPENIFRFSKYYPKVRLLLRNCSVEQILKNYTHLLYSSHPTPTFKEIIEQQKKSDPDNEIWRRPLKLIYHFHGCSDKGYHSSWISPNGHIKDLDLLLIYGKRFERLLKDKNLYHLPKKVVKVGNYRLKYYKEHKKILDQIVENEVFSKFEKKQQTLLYAPTWQDQENSSSFFHIYKTLLEKLPSHLNLIVKLHPNMTLQTKNYDPKPILKIIHKYQSRPNLLFLRAYPVIYPLISKCDFYLGDHSSVNYDVLAFNKPMFFLNINERLLGDKGAHIFQCGRIIEKKEFASLYQIVNEKMDFYLSYQKKLYIEAFGKEDAYNFKMLFNNCE